ncbi:GFA family protein [Sinorhizobium meliloti]|uniref:GFA family protein n=1 Tax=Rhizobium meliloti TaxID=382 RepID=UPI0013E2C24B|nr:GFA family protein [Sinorhizobium meliloti]
MGLSLIPLEVQPDWRCQQMITRTGGCLCGALRYEVSGEPLRVGLCHCADCRKESGSSFVTFAVWPTRAFKSSGEVKIFAGRGFCPDCGSRLFNPGEEETEIRVGSLDDAPAALNPQYEIWVVRRESWLPPLPVPQYPGDRSSG